MKNGIGVMVDDLVAAGFALVVYATVVRLTGGRVTLRAAGASAPCSVALAAAGPSVRWRAASRKSGLNALQTQRQLLYDGWLLFLLAGKAKRARSVNAHFGSTLPLAEKIAHCERLYARHGLPTLFRITPFAQPENLEAELAARGYVAVRPDARAGGDARVTARALRKSAGRARRAADRGVRRSGRRAARLARRRSATRISSGWRSPRSTSTRSSRVVDGVPVGAGLVCIDGGLAGVFDVVTATPLHGRGIGTAVVSALLTRAWERGVGSAFLQVSADNAPAVALYRKFGFATLYTYHYRARPDECR